MSAQNNGSGASDFVSGLQDAMQQNPVSAALIGMGLLWMFTGGNRLSTAAAFFPRSRKALRRARPTVSCAPRVW